MSKQLLLLLLLFIITSIGVVRAMNTGSVTTSELDMRKKILILTSFGGGGNLTASSALENHLKDAYNIESNHVFKELLEPLDPVSFSTFGRCSGEEFYNLFVPSKSFTFLGWVYSMGAWYMQQRKEKIYTILHDYFIKTKPDLIVSVVPIINNIVLAAAQDLNIPFLLMPTDLDVSPYIINITQPTYKQFYLGIAFDDEEIMAPINKASIPQENIFTLGSPLRDEFFTEKNKSLFRKKYAFDENKFTIMVLMGSQGSTETEKYVAELLKLNEPIHIVACIGKNEASRQNLLKLSVPEHISLSIVGFTKDIADYMAISDIFISKSGTLSVCEALYMNLPLFLDATSGILPWEKFNLHFIKKHGFGECIENYNQIVPLVANCIQNPSQLEYYKNNIRNLEKKNFPQEARNMIERILGK